MNWGNYTELHPDSLEAIRMDTPVIYMPWGALEWHGDHLPTGVDGFIAQAVAERCIQETGGVMLPIQWWAATPIPHATSLPLHADTLSMLCTNIFTSLAETGWRIVVILTGHYAEGHELVLIRTAQEAIKKHNLLVLAIPPMALIDETMLDHAALWQTSLMLALRPDLVHMPKFDGPAPIPPSPEKDAIIGQDPRGTASASMGRQAIKLAVQLITRSVEQLLKEDSPQSLYALYEKRRMHLQPFVERYDKGSLEEANLAWWHDLCAGNE